MRPRLVGYKDKLMRDEEVDALLEFLDRAAASGEPVPGYIADNRRRAGRCRHSAPPCDPPCWPRQAWRDYWRAARLAVRILLQSGLRCAEVAELQARDCDIGSRPYRLLVRGGKKRRADEVDAVLIPGDLADQLREWIAAEQLRDRDHLIRNSRGRRVSSRWVYELAKDPMRHLALNPKFATHHYRHRYATTLLQRTDGNLLFVQQQLRHRSLQPTSAYLHMADYEATALDAVDRMSLDGGNVQTSTPPRDDQLALRMQLEAERRGRRRKKGGGR